MFLKIRCFFRFLHIGTKPTLVFRSTKFRLFVHVQLIDILAYLHLNDVTAKYNAVTFLPRFLFEQFRRYANIFFLFIALLQQIPDVSPTGRYTTAFPLLCILSVSAVKEIIEDLKRRKADSKVNHSKTVVFEPQGMAYVETANLDENRPTFNWTLFQYLLISANLLTRDDLYSFSALIECEAPNPHLYEFTGTLIPTSGESCPLGPDQVLLRGAQLKNTRWIFGVVVYTGCDTKLVKNSSVTPLKRSNVDRTTNSQILLLFVTLMIISLVSAISAQIWSSSNQSFSWYLGFSTHFGYNFLTFIILYNNLIPISLQVTLEVVRFLQAQFINLDLEMYHEPTDQPAMARTSNLNEELGQVKYIFSDKTGTLTKNIMRFKKCSIAGVMYGSDDTDEFEDPALLQNLTSRHVTAPMIKEFLTLMTICHTAIPEKESDPSEITYRASSPDEGALVRGAKNIGFVFHTRTPEAVFFTVLGREERYEVLNVLEFTSDRKRMSVIFRNCEGKIKLYTKGADSVIFERLADNQIYLDVTVKHLEEFASHGYRTLCLARADISEEFYQEWRKKYYEASISIEQREKKLSDAAELIEQNLILLGATAIEDKLQDGVPETISSLLKADIKIWVLTGDKQETAINIGHSCNLLTPGIPLLIVNKSSYEVGGSIVSSSISLEYVLSSDLRRMFLDLAVSCRVVICCRVTPLQKAEVVDLVRQSVGAITLAIGDGCSISNFLACKLRALRTTLSLSFHRTVKLILYCFHKNICLYIIEVRLLSLLTAVVRAAQRVVRSDIVRASQTMMKYPALYKLSQNRDSFNIFWLWIMNAVYHSVLLFWLGKLAIQDVVWRNGRTGGLYMLGNSIYTYVVVTVCLKAGLEMDAWTWVNFCFHLLIKFLIFNKSTTELFQHFLTFLF
ncbi:unnamed protein product [Soboliphyme baturini]|uniref:PLD phosphodiesterase domain-containing protein n=1 Tax=Soboliphyme baturini TaxID=241478 RepID=A0A183II87_9BILA|nr:unnamed protein product [Soboliphyme baturini]